MQPFNEKVYGVVRKIPRGRVTTYREITRVIGRPRAARAVGNALNKNPYRSVPCHRVVCSDGKVGGYARGVRKKEKLLRSEGVVVTRSKIDLGAFGHNL